MTLVEAATLLRATPDFLSRLRSLVEEHQKPSVARTLSAILSRLDQIENRIEALDEEFRENDRKEISGPDPSWSRGSGIGRKLTEAGAAEVVRLIERGYTDKQIAGRMACSISSIAARRKAYDLEMAARSGY